MSDLSENSNSDEATAKLKPRAPVRQDFDTLRTLSVIHIVLAGVFAFGILALLLHYAFTLYYFYNDDTLIAQRQNQPLSSDFKLQLLWVYLSLGALTAFMALLNFLISKHLYQGTRYRFIQFVSYLNCLLLPMGTIVGIWTLVVLGRDQVKSFFLRSE